MWFQNARAYFALAEKLCVKFDILGNNVSYFQEESEGDMPQTKLTNQANPWPSFKR